MLPGPSFVRVVPGSNFLRGVVWYANGWGGMVLTAQD